MSSMIGFYFRDGAPSVVRARIDAALRDVESMIVGAVRQFLPNACEADQDDAAQIVRIHLATVSLPKFNADGSTKVSTFCRTCIHNVLVDHTRAAGRRIVEERTVAALPESTAPDRSLDARIEAMAEDVAAHPEKYLSQADARIFRALIAHPQKSRKELARDLGFNHQSDFSTKCRAIRERIAAISIEDWEGIAHEE